MPESFKVLLKELQSLGLDVRVLKDNGQEVKIMESVDYGNTSFRSIMEDADRYAARAEEDRLAEYGFAKQEFRDGELVDAEEDQTASDAARELLETADE